MLERHTEGVDEKVMTAKGEKIFLNISIGEKKEPVTFDNRTYTHYVSCAPRKAWSASGRL